MSDIPWFKMYVDEEELEMLKKVYESRWFSQGPMV